MVRSPATVLMESEMTRFWMPATFFAFFLGTGAALAQDAPGSKDHPLLSRFSGAVIEHYRQTDFDAAELADRRIDNAQTAKSLHVEGKVTNISYLIKGDKSLVEVVRNYQQAVKQGGFQKIFSCAREACGGLEFEKFLYNNCCVGIGFFYDPNAFEYYLGKLSRPGGDVYVSLYLVYERGNQSVAVVERVVEVQPMQGGEVQVLDAKSLQAGLASAGRVALYGIYFDTDRAEVKPGSKAQLDEMGKLLVSNPALKVFIVGHTDNQGTFEHNVELSQRRADAVAEALVKDYHVAAGRLIARGVASLAPAAANADEAGRASNRRVELVAQ